MDSKERLVEAMSSLMWERGFTATSPRAVRERSGVGQGSMYHHFKNKRELGLAAIENNCEIMAHSAERRLGAPGDPLDRLIDYLTKKRDPLKGGKAGRMTQDPEVVADEGLRAPIAAAFDRVHAALVATIREAIDLGRLPVSLDPEQFAYVLFASVQGGYVLAMASQDPQIQRMSCAGAVEIIRALEVTD